MKVVVTHTDTFGGEANYSWVKRYEFYAKDTLSSVSAVRRAKKLAGLTNYRCRTCDYGDYITIRPSGRSELVTVDFS